MRALTAAAIAALLLVATPGGAAASGPAASGATALAGALPAGLLDDRGTAPPTSAVRDALDVLQLAALLTVVGSYVVARELQVKAPQRRRARAATTA